MSSNVLPLCVPDDVETNAMGSLHSSFLHSNPAWMKHKKSKHREMGELQFSGCCMWIAVWLETRSS